MTRENRFAPLSVETAPEAARPVLAASAKNFGFLPSPLAKAAHSPKLLKHLLAGFGAFESSSLTALEREVVAFTVAFEIECSYCIAMHSAILSRAPDASSELVEDLREGRALPDPSLEALRLFVREVVQARGRVSADQWQRVEAAGFSEQKLLDAVLGVGVYLLSTLMNVVTRAELDAPFEAFRWHKASPVAG
ncbi:MAG TPA: carboxymuconolactone decarboxylase family protein [Polyangiales bacterium]|nr:carboxymuconolactone decarboxylase family protein [Polyangiales bacterium]